MRLSIMTLLTVLAVPAHADTDAEREALARLSHEIEALEPLIGQAETQADPGARIRFRYDWLRRDLARIRAGIADYVLDVRERPRDIPPLKGDYRR